MKPLEVWQPDHCAEALKILGDPIRLRIIRELRGCVLNVTQLCEILQLPAVTVSHHLQILLQGGFLLRTKQGRFAHYSLNEEVIARSSNGDIQIDLQCCKLDLPKE